MKNSGKRRIITAIIIGVAAVATFVCGMALTGCNNSKPETKTLETPVNLKITDDYLTWDEVPQTKGYVVYVNGEEYETPTNSLDIMEITNKPANYKFSVAAVGDLTTTFDSGWSEKIKYNVSYPENLKYERTNGGTYIVSAIGTAEAKNAITGKLVIPEIADNGMNVTAIDTCGFEQCKNITSVYVPDSITAIGGSAFAECTSLSRVRLPNDFDKLEFAVFEECYSLKGITLPNKLTVINSSVFKDCSALKEIVIPSGVTQIGSSAFENCLSLEKIELNEGLKKIGANAFGSCIFLKTLELPNSIEWISTPLAPRCDSLQNIYIAQGENEFYKSDGNCIIKKSDNSVIIGCNYSVIPDYAEVIGNDAFAYCRIMKTVTIPGNVKEIKYSAFCYCRNLQNVTFSEGVKKFDMAFMGCESLESVHLPATFEAITFKGNIFAGCDNLKSITVAEDNPVYKSDGNCIIRKADNTVVCGCNYSVIPAYVTAIGSSAFCECIRLSKIVIPDGVEEIGEEAFKFCRNVREIYIPDSVKTIGKSAFSYCCFASVTIPESVQTIESGAFNECKIYATGKWGDKSTYKESVLAHDSDCVYPYVYSTQLSNYKFSNAIGDISNLYVMIAPRRTGYTFLGWATEEGSNEVVYKPEVVTVRHQEGHQDIYNSENVAVTYIDDYSTNMRGTVLYAVWQKNN